MKKKNTIIHFSDIPSNNIKELKAISQRAETCMGSDGTIYVTPQNIYKTTIYSYEITKDIHKVHISDVVCSSSLLEKRPQFKVAGFYIKDIPQVPTNLKKEEERLRTILKKSGYPEEKINSEIEAAQTQLTEYADEFIGSNYSHASSCIYYRNFANGESEHELIVPRELFERSGTSRIYLYVASYKATVPKVQAYSYPKDTLYFYEEPVAESVTEGNSLLSSRIMLGEVRQNGKKLNGFFFWAAPFTKVQSKGKDSITCKAYFCSVPKASELKKKEELFNKKVLKASIDAKKSSKTILEKKLIEYATKTLKLGIYEYNQPITVYPKINSPFNSFIWRTNCLAQKKYVETANTENQIHHDFKNLFDNFGFDGIYNSFASFNVLPTTSVAKAIARAMLQQPKGRRSISLDGFLTQLMGAAIYEAESKSNTMISANDSDKGNIIPKQINKDRRLFRDYLYSMIYSDAATDYSGEGFFFYDSPIHYNRPKYDLGSEISPDLASALIKMDDEDPTGHAFVKKVIEYWKTAKRYHSLLSEQMNIGDPDNPKDKRPTSGCHAIKKLLQEIFKIVNSYKINIDYVYSDLEQITNVAWSLRTKHRIEQNNDYLYDIDLYKKNGELSYEKMWNAAFSSPRFIKEIQPKLEARGFYHNENKNLPWTAVKGAFWRTNPTERPAMGYWISNSYASRREINIWDCVMEEYYIGLLEKYLFAPVKKYNPKARYSAYHVNGSKGYNSYGKNIRFEPHLGGNINIGKKMSSCTALYGGQLSEGHCKYNLDDYRCFVEDNSSFAKFKNEVNTMRAMQVSTPAGTMPFYSCKYFRGGDSDRLYKETLFHCWLTNPDQMIAYLNYETDNFGKYFNTDNVEEGKHAYFRACYQDIQEILDELNKYITKPIEKILSVNTINENENFVLSGVQVVDRNIWRLTPKEKFPQKASLSQTTNQKNEFIFKIGEKEISFKGKRAEILYAYTNDNNGVWIITPKTVLPEITSSGNYFKVNPSYETDKPQKSSNSLFAYMGSNESLKKRQQNFWHMQGVSVFGEYAPQQIWEAHVRFNKLKEVLIFRSKATDFAGIEIGKWYTIRAIVTLPNINDVEKGCEYQGEIKYFCKADDETEFREIFKKSITEPLDGNVYKPIQYVQIGETDSVDTDSFKVYITGKNVRADLFRENDGVNITRVNKNISDYKDSTLANTRVTDQITAKISWLNASDDTETYVVKINQYDQKGKSVKKSTLSRIYVGVGIQDYKVITLPSLNPKTRILEIEILDKNNEGVFLNSIPVVR